MALSGGVGGFVSFKQHGPALGAQWRGVGGAGSGIRGSTENSLWVGDWLWAGPLFRLSKYPGKGGRAVRPYHPSGIVTVTYLTLLLSHRAQRYSH